MSMAAAGEQRRPACSPPPGAAIRVVDTALVHPSPETTSSLPLTFYDVFWLRAPPVQRVLFYRLLAELGDADVEAVLANLKRSLSLALGAFLPLAGRLRLTPGKASNRYELHYSPGDGAVTFTVAEYDHEVDGLAGDEPREVSKLAPLAPTLPEGGAVLAVQATVLLSGRVGLALGVTVHHAACDGAASTHFLHTWVAFAAGGARPLPAPPVTDRALISDPTGLYDVYFRAVTVMAAPSTDKNTHLFATFALSKHLPQRVKDAVAATRGVTTCSSLVAALGLVWSCYHQAKKPAAAAATEACCLLFTVDHRFRMSPPLPDKYFGNCVGPALAITSRTELVETGAGGIRAACKAITAAIQDAVSVIGTARMVLAKDRVKQAAATTDLFTVAGSPRFKVYELDFGFGPPAKVDIVSVARNGAIAVAESRDGYGGVEVGVCLPPDGMAAFRNCFADAVARLDLDTED